MNYIIGFYWALWIVLIIVGVGVFYRGKDAALKRKWWPYYCSFFGASLALCMALFISQTPASKTGQDQHLEVPIIILLVSIGGLTFFNIKRTQFCDKCAAIIRAKFQTIKFCPKCGAELPKK